jgi:hypothetical protein
MKKKKTSKHPAVKIKSLQDFLSKVQAKGKVQPTLFRGLTKDFPLVPKIGRSLFQGDKRGKSFEENERRLFEDFRRLSVPFFNSYHPKNDWELLSIGQHFGLPTRLLDWSLNPLVALFFALDGYRDERHPPVIWQFKPEDSDFVDQNDYFNSPFIVQRTKVFPPPVVNDRLRAQAGWFSIHKRIKDSAGREWFVPLEQQQQYIGNLVKYELEINTTRDNQVDRYKFLLSQLGINAGTIYPDLAGLSRHLEWEYFPSEFEK